MPSTGAYVTQPDGTRVWDPTAGPPPGPKKIRKPRPARALNAVGVDRWAKGTWKWSAPNADGVRTRVSLTPEERAERTAIAEATAERRRLLDAVLSDLAEPLLERPGDPAARPERVLLKTEPEPARVLIEHARDDGKVLRVLGRTWITRDGEAVDYVNAHVARRVEGGFVRTFGVAIRCTELPAVIAALQAEHERFEREGQGTSPDDTPGLQWSGQGSATAEETDDEAPLE